MPSSSLDTDTIVAIASGAGPGGIGVIRLSGRLACNIALTISHKQEQPVSPRHAYYCTFYDSQNHVIDDGILLFFPGPASFTGEDVVECQIHGSAATLNRLVSTCIAHGARQARPGEFSERAFLNGKMDLLQAEAVADLINAQTESAATQAQASLRGDFSNLVNELADEITALRVFIEAAIDFPEEEVDFLSDGKVEARLLGLCQRVRDLLSTANQGRLFQEGANVVLAGAPNAGKSSLLNLLAKEAIAIVTSQAGTTRDVLTTTINLGGVPIIFSDTAGLRETSDQVEVEGVRRAKLAIQEADLVLEVIDDSITDNENMPLALDKKVLRVLNKIDLSGRAPGINDDQQEQFSAISTLSGEGVDALKKQILSALGVTANASSLFSARKRHVNTLNSVANHLNESLQRFSTYSAGELLAEDLRQAHEKLGEITGRVTSDDLLGKIFSSFCIGK
ncbi:MAG: tRNA uridine-5-carboxymethylaminomethyl(34) synthesis GTPase MnmE [Halieaceae bacterium]